MFWSKIWFFLTGVLAVCAVGVCLILPRPAQRKVVETDEARLLRARWGVDVLLREEARGRLDLALFLSRLPPPEGQQPLRLDAVLGQASRSDKISQNAHNSAAKALEYVLGKVNGKKPELVMAVDAQGRVVARAGLEANAWGDDVGGYFLVRDALRGYLRDDLWIIGNNVFRVVAAPVLEGDSYVGVIVVGDPIDTQLARDLEQRASTTCTGEGATKVCDTHVAFFARGETRALSAGDTAVAGAILTEYKNRKAEFEARGADGRPKTVPPFTVTQGEKTYRVAIRLLPGEVSAQEGFFATFAEESPSLDTLATLKNVAKDDVSFGHFPWIPLGLGLALVIVLGMVFMWLEAERPLRRLLEEAILLGKGDIPALLENTHKGKYGSVSRSINIALERLQRAAKPTPRKELPEDEPQSLPPRAPLPLGSVPLPDLPARPTPSAPKPPVAIGGFDFDIPPPPPAAPAKPPLPPIPSARPPAPPPPPPRSGPMIEAPALDDDILSPVEDSKSGPVAVAKGGAFDEQTVAAAPDQGLLDKSRATDADEELVYFRQVFNEYVDVKKSCGESLDGLTEEKFLAKLRANKEQLVTKYGCKSVKFQVYVKDGKAALKATPVK